MEKPDCIAYSALYSGTKTFRETVRFNFSFSMRNMFIEDELVKGFLCPNAIVDIIKDTRDKPWSRRKAML